MEASYEYPCVVCSHEVLDDQEALECDSCKGWQHLACGSGISSETYWKHVRDGTDLNWTCDVCSRRHTEPPISPIEPMSFSFDQAASTCREETTTSFKEDTLESSMSDPSARQTSVSSALDETVFTVLVGGSTRGTDKLFDNNGYSYTLKRTNVSGSKLWRCAERTFKNSCRATVRQQTDGTFEKLASHNHPGKIGALDAARIAKTTKEEAMKDPLKSAPLIAQEVIHRHLPAYRPCPALQSEEYLARNANNARERVRPKDPKTLDFALAEWAIPDNFLKSDIQFEGSRHLIFATEKQLSLLRSAKTWYVDATFKVVKKPFYQLFTIHAFVRKNEEEKQVPLLFCLMSRRRATDYIAILEKIRSILDEARVKKVVMDFEAAMWRAFRRIFPSTKLKGCSFHYTQAVFRKIKELGLQPKYRRRQAHHEVMRKVMALCYLPAAAIQPEYERLLKKTEDDGLRKLLGYVGKNWIASKSWPPSTWSVYGSAIRTNNDVEGWHTRLNCRGRVGMSLYRLVPLLHQEACFSEMRVTLISMGKLKRRRRKASQDVDAKLYKFWEDYQKGTTARKLLKKVSKLVGPCA